jgi:hypothetical protein
LIPKHILLKQVEGKTATEQDNNVNPPDKAYFIHAASECSMFLKLFGFPKD